MAALMIRGMVKRCAMVSPIIRWGMACICLLVFILINRRGGILYVQTFGYATRYPNGQRVPTSWGNVHRPYNASALSCPSIMDRLLHGAPAVMWPPPCPLDPSKDAALIAAYERPHGSMPISKEYCLQQRYEGHREISWSKDFIEELKYRLKWGLHGGTYGPGSVLAVTQVFEKYRTAVHGARGMVIGTENPWVECLALSAGASEVTTFEYGAIKSSHPQVLTPSRHEIANKFLAGEFAQMDFMASYSSIEHSGLGRYGDTLNPEGDVEAMAEAWCLLKPGGLFFLGLPMACADKGRIEFNAHRVYGYDRIKYITNGYELVEFANGGCAKEEMSVAVFRKVLS